MLVSPMTRFVLSSIAILGLGLTVVVGAEKAAFRAGPADSYSHQSSTGITVGAKAFDKPELVEEVFGKKVDLLKYGVLPVLVVIENKTKNALDLKAIDVNLVAADGRHAGPVGPEELFSLKKTKPKTTVSPLPFPMPSKKNPFNTPELVTQSFTAKFIPPGDSASGVFYFEARPEPEDRLYVNGLRDARSGQEILYFEFPLYQVP